MNRWERNNNGRLERCPSREELLYQEGITRGQRCYIREAAEESGAVEDGGTGGATRKIFFVGTSGRKLATALLSLKQKVVRVAVGQSFSLMLTDDNQLFAVGLNRSGQLGRGHINYDLDNRVPRLVNGVGLEHITQIVAGYSHCAALTKGGKLLLWGCNLHGQCGTAGDNVFVACGAKHTVALTSNGDVIVFGGNDHGQLGTGNNDDQPTPERLACAALDGVRIVGCAAGEYFTQLVSDDGRVFAMGRNNFGQLGTGDTTSVNTPHEINAAYFGGEPVAAVACGRSHTMAITRDNGKLYCWGQRLFGATGGPLLDRLSSTPTLVKGNLEGARVVRIAAGLLHSCALVDNGHVFVFGSYEGIPWLSMSMPGIPQRLQLGEVNVCSIGGGGCAMHSAFIQGTPPVTPGFESPVESPRERMAAFRIHRFWRDVNYNPSYKHARKKLLLDAYSSDEGGSEAHAPAAASAAASAATSANEKKGTKRSASMAFSNS